MSKLPSLVFTAQSSYASAVLVIVILSVCHPSVTRVLCDKIKEHTADILTLRERAITLVFGTNRGWSAMSPST